MTHISFGRRRVASVAVACGLATAMVAAVPTMAVGVTVWPTPGTETQITTNPANQYDPAISGRYIVYTGDTGALGTDIFYYDTLTEAEVQVTSLNGKQQLSDVSDDTIVYTDFAPPIVDGVRSGSDVVVYDIVSGVTQDLTADSLASAGNPAVSGSLVAWEDRRDGNTEIYATDLATGEVRRASNWAGEDTNPAVSGNIIVWERRDGTQREIWFYDWTSETTGSLTTTADDESSPAIDGTTVVYQAVRDGEADIFAYDLVSGTERRLDLPAEQRNPNVSGRLVTFENLSSGIYHVFGWDLVTGHTEQLTSGASHQFLNDVDEQSIVYTDDRNTQQDIYRLVLPDPPGADTTSPALQLPSLVAAVATSTSGAPVTYTVTATDNADPNPSLSCAPASGSVFPLGTTAVSCTATDAAGNTTPGSFDVTVTYAWSGVGQPVNADGSSIFKAGSTIPVKFTLTGASAPVSTATAKLTYAKVSNGIEGSVVEASTNVAATTGNMFRYDPSTGAYIYNWSTKGVSSGTYSVKVDLGDGAPHAVLVSLK